jgi:aspartyl/asparaginyl-tRNA synthetase
MSSYTIRDAMGLPDHTIVSVRGFVSNVECYDNFIIAYISDDIETTRLVVKKSKSEEIFENFKIWIEGGVSTEDIIEVVGGRSATLSCGANSIDLDSFTVC